MESVKEYILSYQPSSKYLREHYIKKGIFIDTREEWLLKALKISYAIKNNPLYNEATIKDRIAKVGSWIFCKDEDYELGRVTKIFNDSTQCLIHFNKKDLPIMCDLKYMITIHDNVKRKLKLIY